LRSCVVAVALSVLVTTLSACGGGSAAPKSTTTHEKPLRVNPALLTDDPDAAFPSGSDIITMLSDLGPGHYRVQVQNESPLGTINSFTWTPPAELRVKAVTGSSAGHCDLVGRSIVCQATLVAPKCTCRPGGVMTVSFEGIVATPPAAGNGVVTHSPLPAGVLTVGALTPVPFIIPSFPGEPVPANADLPFCKRAQHTSGARRCIETG
jgi:hypothetical protein